MVQLIRKLLVAFWELLLYGNFWIAFGALALYQQTKFILTSDFSLDAMSGFVFSSTLFLYAIHRLVGIQKVKKFAEKGRYAVISKFYWHILIYAILGGLIAMYFFFGFRTHMIGIICLPAILSLAYVIPFFSKKRRLRDFHFIKIFTIAFVWAWVTVALPLFFYDLPLSWNAALLFAERLLFVFAITIPFDIRDLKVDEHTQVKTIPKSIGVQKSVYLALTAMALMICISSLLFGAGFYAKATYLGLVGCFLITTWLIQITPRQQHDYFYTGAMDGTMILQGVLVLVANYI